MFRLMYRNPFEDDNPKVVSTSNKTIYDDDAIVYIEDLTTGKRF